MPRSDDRKKLEALKDGQECTLNWFEESGGLATRKGDIYTLEEVTGYGANSQEEGKYTANEFEEMLDKTYSWT